MRARDKAQEGLRLLKEAILELLSGEPEGLRNVDIAVELRIQSDYQGSQKDYLSWSVLGLLLNDGKVIRKGGRYFLSSSLSGPQGS